MRRPATIAPVQRATIEAVHLGLSEYRVPAVLVVPDHGILVHREECILPRAFDESERQTIREQLVEAGRREIGRVGLRNLNVDSVVRAGGISKGSFYTFFPSKEAFVLEVFALVERDVRREMEHELAKPFRHSRELIARFFRFVFDVLEREPTLALLSDPDEAAFLMRLIPSDELLRLRADDDRYFGNLVDQWQRDGIVRSIDKDVFVRLPRVVMAIFQKKERIGCDQYSAVVDLIVDSIAEHLAPNQAARRPKGDGKMRTR